MLKGRIVAYSINVDSRDHHNIHNNLNHGLYYPNYHSWDMVLGIDPPDQHKSLVATLLGRPFLGFRIEYHPVLLNHVPRLWPYPFSFLLLGFEP